MLTNQSIATDLFAKPEGGLARVFLQAGVKATLVHATAGSVAGAADWGAEAPDGRAEWAHGRALAWLDHPGDAVRLVDVLAAVGLPVGRPAPEPAPTCCGSSHETSDQQASHRRSTEPASKAVSKAVAEPSMDSVAEASSEARVKAWVEAAPQPAPEARQEPRGRPLACLRLPALLALPRRRQRQAHEEHGQTLHLVWVCGEKPLELGGKSLSRDACAGIKEIHS